MCKIQGKTCSHFGSFTSFVRWHPIDLFILMRKSGLRDISRTPEYPKGKTIYEGDIVQFLILLKGDDGITKETLIKGTVTFDREQGFVLPEVDDDPLSLHTFPEDKCEIIGTVYEKPEILNEVAGNM
ncbi:MAG: YopX family protein [Ktedonobacteraceae bacterium]